jgi:hypothetical protein
MTRIGICLLALACAVTAWAADLPITDIVLFSSGVGYVQRTGTVTGDATVQLSFKQEQINDLLKSMVLLDLNGGKIGAVTYGAKDPLGKTLASFAINLSDNPSLGEILNRMRGVRVEVDGETGEIGIILGVEKKRVPVGKDIEPVEVEVLNLMTEMGFRSIRLDQLTILRVLDERVNAELQQALQVLATGLDNQRKPVGLVFSGKGERKVVVGYLTETPVWKTSYRLVVGEKANLLQGWAVVENTSDADWTNVNLSLVSGRPISFIQDLYSPLYVRRPVVRPHLYESLTPVEYEANLELAVDGAMAEMPASAPSAMPPGLIGGTFGRAGGRVSLDQMRESTVSAATATDLGQAFEYAIKEPVTLPRQQSALLPIVNGPVEAWPVSIYNPSVHAKFPLYGLRVKNITGVHLMGGPITIYRDDVYAGDATFEDLQPNEQRLVSYAIDLGVQSERSEKAGIQEITAVTLVKGMLNVTRKHRRVTDYTFAIKDGKDRRIMVEHAFLNGWDLVAPKEADERTANLYRFTISATAKDGGKLAVTEERTDLQAIRVVDADTNTLVAYLQTGKISPPVRDALQHVIELQKQVSDLRTQRAQQEGQINTISTEQNRIRQNMAQLDRTSELYKRYVTMLDEQETRIQQLRTEIADLQKQEDAKRKELNDYVAGLNLE